MLQATTGTSRAEDTPQERAGGGGKPGAVYGPKDPPRAADPKAKDLESVQALVGWAGSARYSAKELVRDAGRSRASGVVPRGSRIWPPSPQRAEFGEAPSGGGGGFLREEACIICCSSR